MYACHIPISVKSNFLMLKELIQCLRSWLWNHRLRNFTATEVHRRPWNVTITEAQQRLWLYSGICGVTAITENEVSIFILSWHHKINFKSGDVVKPNCSSCPSLKCRAIVNTGSHGVIVLQHLATIVISQQSLVTKLFSYIDVTKYIMTQRELRTTKYTENKFSTCIWKKISLHLINMLFDIILCINVHFQHCF